MPTYIDIVWENTDRINAVARDLATIARGMDITGNKFLTSQLHDMVYELTDSTRLVRNAISRETSRQAGTVQEVVELIRDTTDRIRNFDRIITPTNGTEDRTDVI